MTAADDEEAARRERLADAARERARAACPCRRGRGRVHADQARAAVGDAWARVHDERAAAAERHADGDSAGALERERETAESEELARAAEGRLRAAELREQAAEAGGDQEQAERRRNAQERDRRIRERVLRQRRRERTFLHRLRPGRGGMWMPGDGDGSDSALDGEIAAIARALDEHGATDRHELARIVGARYWGAGRFNRALREAIDEGRARRVSRSTVAPTDDHADRP